MDYLQIQVECMGDAIQRFIVVCTYDYVIILGLRSKYDMDGHYYIFAARTLDI